MLFFADLFWFLHYLMELLKCIKSIYCRFYWWDLLLLFFSSNQENLYMIHYDSHLFFHIYNTINEHSQNKTTLHRFQIILICVFESFRKLFYHFICSITDHDFYVTTFECITHSSSLSVEEIKVIAITNWIFYVSDFLRLFIVPFKYGLISLRYSSTDGPLFLSLLLSYSI